MYMYDDRNCMLTGQKSGENCKIFNFITLLLWTHFTMHIDRTIILHKYLSAVLTGQMLFENV